MPEHGKHAFLAAEGQEVSHQGIQDTERQGVLLIEQEPQENAVGAVVFHLCQLQHCSAERHQAVDRGGLLHNFCCYTILPFNIPTAASHRKFTGRGLYLEWSTGMEHLVRMLPMMMASRREHVPDSQRGIKIPAVSKEEVHITTSTVRKYSC